MGLVRISVANLIHHISSNNHAEPRYLAILNLKSLAAGERIFKAVGGASRLTPLGMDVVRDGFNATNFDNVDDARFMVASENLERVLDFFRHRDRSFYEIDPRREVEEELAGIELPGQASPILTLTDVKQIETTYSKMVYQQSGTSDKSAREAGTPTHRLFFLSDAYMPDSVYQKFVNSAYCRVLTKGELDLGRAADGIKLGGNLFK